MNLREHVLELLNGGDWACAYAQHETLAHVARQLGALLEGEAAELAREVAATATTDLPSATATWSRLAARLRYGLASGGRYESPWNADT